MRETGGFDLYDIYYAQWSGSEWVERGTVHPPHPWKDGGSRMASGGGEVWIIWGRCLSDPYDPWTVEIYASRWNGSGWDSEIRVAGADSVAYPAGGMNLCVDYTGTPHVVWSAYPGDQEIFYSTFNGDSWREKTQINTPDSAEQDLDPAVAADSLGNLHVVWAARTYGTPYGYELFYTKYDGASWSGEIQFNEPDMRGDYRPRIAANSPDNIWVAWDGVGLDGEYHIYAIHYDGSQWSSEYRLDSDTTDFNQSVWITLNPNGDPWVVWAGEFIDNPTCDIFYNRYEGPQSQFIRSDANGDSTVTLGDAIYILRYLFVPDAPRPSCLKTSDIDDDGMVGLSDATFLLRHLYVPGSPYPSAPFPDCGTDPTPDMLGCEWHPCEE
jgi:hypothetical protein